MQNEGSRGWGEPRLAQALLTYPGKSSSIGRNQSPLPLAAPVKGFTSKSPNSNWSPGVGTSTALNFGCRAAHATCCLPLPLAACKLKALHSTRKDPPFSLSFGCCTWGGATDNNTQAAGSKIKMGEETGEEMG